MAEVGITPLLTHQGEMITLLDNLAAVHHADAVQVLQPIQTVSDQDQRFPLTVLAQ
ncbi:hypothetical protein D3C72_2440630 [compost metagenome]